VTGICALGTNCGKQFKTKKNISSNKQEKNATKPSVKYCGSKKGGFSI
jgi:hypothetical protein